MRLIILSVLAMVLLIMVTSILRLITLVIPAIARKLVLIPITIIVCFLSLNKSNMFKTSEQCLTNLEMPNMQTFLEQIF